MSQKVHSVGHSWLANIYAVTEQPEEWVSEICNNHFAGHVTGPKSSFLPVNALCPLKRRKAIRLWTRKHFCAPRTSATTLAMDTQTHGRDRVDAKSVHCINCHVSSWWSRGKAHYTHSTLTGLNYKSKNASQLFDRYNIKWMCEYISICVFDHSLHS